MTILQRKDEQKKQCPFFLIFERKQVFSKEKVQDGMRKPASALLFTEGCTAMWLPPHFGTPAPTTKIPSCKFVSGSRRATERVKKVGGWKEELCINCCFNNAK